MSERLLCARWIGFFFCNSRGKYGSNGGNYGGKYFNLLSQMGTSLSQVTLLPERRQAAVGEPMSRYLESQNEKWLYATRIPRLNHVRK